MSAALILAMLAPLSASSEQAISHRLMAQSFSLTNSNLQARIWSDQVPDMLNFRKYPQSTPAAQISRSSASFTPPASRPKESRSSSLSSATTARTLAAFRTFSFVPCGW